MPIKLALPVILSFALGTSGCQTTNSRLASTLSEDLVETPDKNRILITEKTDDKGNSVKVLLINGVLVVVTAYAGFRGWKFTKEILTDPGFRKQFVDQANELRQRFFPGATRNQQTAVNATEEVANPAPAAAQNIDEPVQGATPTGTDATNGAQDLEIKAAEQSPVPREPFYNFEQPNFVQASRQFIANPKDKEEIAKLLAQRYPEEIGSGSLARNARLETLPIEGEEVGQRAYLFVSALKDGRTVFAVTAQLPDGSSELISGVTYSVPDERQLISAVARQARVVLREDVAAAQLVDGLQVINRISPDLIVRRALRRNFLDDIPGGTQRWAFAVKDAALTYLGFKGVAAASGLAGGSAFGLLGITGGTLAGAIVGTPIKLLGETFSFVWNAPGMVLRGLGGDDTGFISNFFNCFASSYSYIN